MNRSLTHAELRAAFARLGVPDGATVVLHSSLSAIGPVQGGAPTVVAALRDRLGPRGTLVVPAYTGYVADPCPDRRDPADEDAARARTDIPLFHPDLPSTVGAIPNAVLALPDRFRSPHPQASVAAVGRHAEMITATQPLGYALGRHSPFDRLYDLGALVLLLGVGHNRNSFLHHVETRIAHRRRKTRRFPWLLDGERVYVETEDVADDNDRFFPAVGESFAATGRITRGRVGAADCELMSAVELVDHAVGRLAGLLAGGPVVESRSSS